MFLNCHTQFSYKYGTVSPEVLLETAVSLGVQALAVTDINSTSAGMELLRLAPRYGVKVVLGIDFRNGADQLFVGLAHNNQGFEELNAYLSQFLTTERPPIPARAPVFQHASAVYPLEKFQGFTLRQHEYVGIRPEQVTQWQFSKEKLDLSKCVALHTVSFRHKADFNAHRLLRAIDNNLLLSKLPKTEEGAPHHIWVPPTRLAAAYQAIPEVLQNAKTLLEQCQVHFAFNDDREHQNLAVFTNSLKDDREKLRQLAYDGLEYRYGSNPGNVILERIETELDVIVQKGYLSYFLINWDLTCYARKQGYFYVGRGSGANSILAYLLRITDVDPIELDLYFERFINLYRKNPPDFDIDFSWTDRDDVTRYIFDTYPHTALLGAYVTFQQRAVVRELGKVFGLPKHEIDSIANGQRSTAQLDKTTGLVLRYGQLIAGFPSHCSVHSSGILIAKRPLHHFAATFMPPKGFSTTQFDMVIAEDVGLYKFDILGQRGLAKIKDGIEIVAQNQGIVPDVHDVRSFKEDPIINGLLKQGKAIGAFYVESPAMRMLLSKLKVDTYLGLVAASSVIRPGVSQSGMMREYILRFREPERRKDAHPILLEIMPDTYGVMVYQEDVIKVAHHFAKLSLAEADVLRRGMSGKYRSRDEFQSVKDKFFNNCDELGHPHSLTSDIWRQIESFAGYAFAKGHSASYAVESYQSLFLKAYYPLEFMVAVINNGGGFYQTEFYVHEARMAGANILPPCINRSEGLCTIYGKDLYMGLGFLHEVDSALVNRILENRRQHGPFFDFNDFVDRISISIEQVSILIRVEAFRFTGKSKRQLLWDAHFKLVGKKSSHQQTTLFSAPHRNFDLPQLPSTPLEDAFDQIELLGFPLCHPFNLVAEKPSFYILAAHLPKLKGELVEIWGYLVTRKNTRTSKGDYMNFGTFLDYSGHFFDTTHFPKVAVQYPFRGGGVYAVVGTVEEEFGFFSIEVHSMRKIDMIPDPRYDDGNEKSGSIQNFIR